MREAPSAPEDLNTDRPSQRAASGSEAFLPTDTLSLGAYALLAFAVVLMLGQSVPADNEHHYLYNAYRLFHADFAVSDVGLGAIPYGHLLYQATAGALMMVLPIEAVGWILRLTAWTWISVTLLRLGMLLGVRPWMTTLAIIVWLTSGQSWLGQEWIMGGAEAKTFAYPLLFMAAHDILSGKPNRAALLIGFSVTVHPVVGVQLGGAMCLATLFAKPETFRLPAFVALVVLGSIPGVVLTLLSSVAGGGLTNADWQFVARYGMPYSIDPSSFPMRGFVNLVVAAAFNLAMCWRLRDEAPYRFIGVLHLALGLLMAGGLLAWVGGSYSALQLMPFRVFPVLTPLLFLMLLGDAARRGNAPPTLWVLAAWGLTTFAEPVTGVVDLRFRGADVFPNPEEAYAWIAEQTPPDALILSPPSAVNAISRSERGQVAYSRWIRLRELEDWRERHEAVLGPAEAFATASEWLSQYDKIDIDRVREVTRRYGATHFVTQGVFELPLLFEDDQGWKVYDLTALGGG